MQGRILEIIDDAFDVDKSKVEGYYIYYTAWNGIRWCTFYFYSVVDYRGVNSQYVVLSFPTRTSMCTKYMYHTTTTMTVMILR